MIRTGTTRTRGQPQQCGRRDREIINLTLRMTAWFHQPLRS